MLRKPLIFYPQFKQVIWGGERIGRYKNLDSAGSGIGESWEISALPGHESVVSEGEYEGESLPALIERFGADLLGSSVMERYDAVFPLLFKFIDADKDLSIQVHPDDYMAGSRHGGSGKSEMWYIIHAEPDSRIFAGFRHHISKDEYVAKIEEGDIVDSLATHKPRPGDVFFIPAGRVHSIGAGILLAEIQQSSDITYRIYDFDRRDASGKKRELHTELAKDAIDFSATDHGHFTPEADHDEKKELVKSNHFSVWRIKVDGDKAISAPQHTFSVIMCVEGKIDIDCEDGRISLAAGHTALIPACVSEIKLSGKATLLFIWP